MESCPPLSSTIADVVSRFKGLGGDGELCLEVVDGSAEPLIEHNFGLPVQKGSRQSDIRLTLFRIILRQGFLFNFVPAAKFVNDQLSQIQYGKFIRISQIDGANGLS